MSSDFNLLDEPWILVIDKNGEVAELSLKEVLLKAHNYVSLAGESPAQDVAILRLLIAVVHTVFYRMDENGNDSELEDEEEALDRWKELWDRRKSGLPGSPIEEYLNEWHGRFNLFDEKYPFYQAPEAEKRGTLYSVAKLNGQILQSGNKLRIFSNRTEETRNSLTFEEAARWLVYLQGFDDNACTQATGIDKHPTGMDDEKVSAQVGWLGNLGIIYAVGDSLLETIILNLTFLRYSELYDYPSPCWENNPESEGYHYTTPDNIPELFTTQSRRICLIKNGDCVTNYREYVGVLLKKEDIFTEPMTIWKKVQKSKYSPQPHDPSKKLWRDFSSLVVEQNRIPGVVYWLGDLKKKCYLTSDAICFASVSVLYDEKRFSVKDIISDSLYFHASLLGNLGKVWQKLIEDQIKLCDNIAEQLRLLGNRVCLASGRRSSKKEKREFPEFDDSIVEGKRAKEQFYFRIDNEFRRWLVSLRAEQESVERDDLCNKWNETAIRIARELGSKLVEEAGFVALTGQWIDVKRGNQINKEYYSAPKAYNIFNAELKKLSKRGG
ncbi:type I-E CRISPR-associated protein Cse1/CasA [bacterium]|nr:type I-E CRISPR-associated protein Cse1/CasA [bacterium]